MGKLTTHEWNPILIHPTEFFKKTIATISRIPEGKVATYKQIAELAGKPQGSRGVAWILHSCSRKYKLPWHRVLSSQGKISFEYGSRNFREQKRRLERENVSVTREGKLNLQKYQWRKRPPPKKTSRATPKMFS
jgi:methylated-DNA-protein-cysteine methyltransferase-like protein